MKRRCGVVYAVLTAKTPLVYGTGWSGLGDWQLSDAQLYCPVDHLLLGGGGGAGGRGAEKLLGHLGTVTATLCICQCVNEGR